MSYGASSGSGGSGTNRSGTLATLEAISPALGDMGIATDSPYQLFCRSAGTWSYIYPGVGFDVTKPPSTGWTLRNSADTATVGGMQRASFAAGAGVNYRLITRARPSDPTTTPYFVEFGIAISDYAGGEFGVNWFQTSDSKFIVGVNGDGGFNYQDYTNYTTWTAHNEQISNVKGAILLLRLEEDEATRYVYIGNPNADGGSLMNETTWYQVGVGDARTNHITADAVGWGGYVNDAGKGVGAYLFHYKTGAI